MSVLRTTKGGDAVSSGSSPSHALVQRVTKKKNRGSKIRQRPSARVRNYPGLQSPISPHFFFLFARSSALSSTTATDPRCPLSPPPGARRTQHTLSRPTRVSAAAVVIFPFTKMLDNGALLRAVVLGGAFFAQLSSCFVVPGSSPVATRYPGAQCGCTPLVPRPPVRASSVVR